MTPTIALFPARGGSKRIPFKNRRNFHGKPMISWPIRTAMESNVFDRLIVSTDDPEIAKVAREAGAETPFMRDAALSDDMTGTSAVIVDAIVRLDLPDDAIIACIYPTAVFLEASDLNSGVEKLVNSDLAWVFTVCEFSSPIQRAYRRTDAGLFPVNRDAMPCRSQDLDPHYYDAGQVYFAQAATWKTPGAHVWDGADGIILPGDRCIDIDTEEDWQFAVKLFKQKFSEKLIT